ncbi:MAG: FAD-dependent pyridine nucleotide-disulfide oxidoreductase [Cypionkella sp.]|uniref:RNA polymerase factor sigma-54 n=1 Tax=Cypionkella sp. TaxID=2811411 RepID=UPI0026051A66|nr:RNA polymerase factor sigma-54 [Cypionkella sp.]MDB5658959.1 FAD-dependent pyridine nucleotide-disulfide oxidoreductase [Cypionkella sp.]
MRSPQQRIGLTQTQRLELNISLQASIAILRTDAAGLTRYLEEQAADNPHLRLEPPPQPSLQDWLPRWAGVLSSGGGLGLAAETADTSPSLIAHVMDEIEKLRLNPRDNKIAVALAEVLEPSGWLGAELSIIVAETGSSLAEVEAVLRRLQQFEPTGVFARNLADCLRLQAIEAEAMDSEMAAVLSHLDLLAAGDLAKLAKVCGISEAAVLQRFRIIRAMNPKPGAEFASISAAQSREPDLVVKATATGWSIALNRSALPTLRVEKSDAGSVAGFTAAKALERMVDARNATLLLVGREILLRQQEAIRQGPIALQPMTMAELAEALGFHESTISRVVAGASLDSPRGTWWLRQMFSPALGGNGQPLISGAAMRGRLARLVAAENPARPLSDEALAMALAIDTGVTIARRTVAKYREAEGIPIAGRRKRKPVLPRMGRKGRAEG